MALQRVGHGSELEPPVTRGVFIQQINREGTPLCCFDDAGVSPRPKILRTQQPEVAFEAHFTRSSTMMFLLSEIIMHALATINSPAQRGEREQPTCPAASSGSSSPCRVPCPSPNSGSTAAG